MTPSEIPKKPRRRGRPPLHREHRVSLHIVIPPSWRDVVFEMADQRGVSASHVVREAMSLLFAREARSVPPAEPDFELP